MFSKEPNLKGGGGCTKVPFLRTVVLQLRSMLIEETLQSDGKEVRLSQVARARYGDAEAA